LASFLHGIQAVRILVADDDKVSCQLLTEVLEAKGHQVEWTTDALEGYRKSTTERFDLFIFDVRMPLILGTEMAEALREQQPASKIILISAFADEVLRTFAASRGLPLLSKPFSTDDLLQVVRKTIDG
jgi:CheY-like chemotaxis protein